MLAGVWKVMRPTMVCWLPRCTWRGRRRGRGEGRRRGGGVYSDIGSIIGHWTNPSSHTSPHTAQTHTVMLWTESGEA